MTIRLKCIFSPSCYRIWLGPAQPCLVPLAFYLVSLGPQLEWWHQSGFFVVAEGRRGAKLSPPSSLLILLLSITFHVADLLGVQGLCDLGREGCAAVGSPIPQENAGASKLSLNFKKPSALKDQRKRPNCYCTSCYTCCNRSLGKTVTAIVQQVIFF